MFLLQRRNRLWPAALLQPPPVFHQFFTMHFGPAFHKTLLPKRKRPRNKFDGRKAVNSHRLLVVSMEMRQMMWSEWFRIHSNNNSKKTRKFRHSSLNLR